MNLGQVQDPEAYTISQRESEEYDKWEFLLEAKSNRQAEIKMQAGMSSMLIIAWRMSCSQILRELHFVICVGDLMIAFLQHFFFHMWRWRIFVLRVKLERGLLPKQIPPGGQVQSTSRNPC